MQFMYTWHTRQHAMHTQRHIYYHERCAHCNQRACITEREDYLTLACAHRVCERTESPGRDHCLDVCCHGCECTQADTCEDWPTGQCPCDCHCEPLYLVNDPLPVESEEEEEEGMDCHCTHCARAMPLYEDFVQSADVWTSNRPRHCKHFDAASVSTYFDNADGSNTRIETYFTLYTQ